MITTKYKAYFDKAFEGFARRVIAARITPNQLTLAALALSALACLYLVWSRNLLIFSVLMTLLGCLDAVDGLVARLTKTTSKFGSYLDAMCDRYFECFALIAAAYVTGYWLLSMIVMMGCLLISYSKARAAMEVAVSNTEWPDFFERTERDVLFAAGLFLSQVFPRKFFGHDLFFWTLVTMAAGTHLTAIQRQLRAKKIIEGRG